MTNNLHFSEWRNCIRAQLKVNLCAPGAPKGPKVGMSVRQYEMLCANDAGRAPRKYPVFVVYILCMNSSFSLHALYIPGVNITTFCFPVH